MTITVHTFCLAIAAALFAVAAVWSPPRGNLVAAGLFFLSCAFLFG